MGMLFSYAIACPDLIAGILDPNRRYLKSWRFVTVVSIRACRACSTILDWYVHWIKDTIRDGDIDLRDISSVNNLADFLTKIVLGPTMWAASDVVSGYTTPPASPPPLTHM
jgi:hypothetical protein